MTLDSATNARLALDNPRVSIAVVIPCYKVRKQILSVIEKIGDEVTHIFVVDDLCPEKSGEFVKEHCTDPRLRIIFNEKNKGVGGTTMTGFRHAIAAGAEIIVKVDGDGQMDPALIPHFVFPVLSGLADYAKGNRFYSLDGFASMPLVRKIGNLGLSFFTKLSSGYWHIFDPTNGYFAIHASVAALLDFEKIDPRYFFESDMLFRLNLLDAVVCDVPMQAHYADEHSSLNVLKALPEFLYKNLKNISRRIFYNYFLRDFSPASLALLGGSLLVIFGLCFGAKHWLMSMETHVVASSGTVMLAAFPLLIGTGLLISFLNYDLLRRNSVALHKRILGRKNLFSRTGSGL